MRLTSPYRVSLQDPEEYDLYMRQMYEACTVLHLWRKYSPVIAGGSLWSWADGQPARDVDVFIQRSWWAKRLAAKRYGSLMKDKSIADVYIDSYGHMSREYPVSRYMSELPSGTPLDFVITSAHGVRVVDRFDYYHCKVAFGVDGYTTEGARYFADATLKRQDEYRSTVRREGAVYAKIASCSLWGRDDAEERLEEVMHTLRRLYKRINEDDGR